MSGERGKPVRRNRGLVEAERGQSGGTPSARGLVLIIDAMLVGVGGVFLATTSVPVTVIAAISALVLTVVILTVGR